MVLLSTIGSRGHQQKFFEFNRGKVAKLEKSAHASIVHPVGSGCYFDTHRLIHPESGASFTTRRGSMRCAPRSRAS